MKLRIKILDNSGDETKEMVVDVPPDITAKALMGTLQSKRPNLFSSHEYVANVEIPPDKQLNGRLLDDGTLVVIRPRGWDVKIIEE